MPGGRRDQRLGYRRVGEVGDIQHRDLKKRKRKSDEGEENKMPLFYYLKGCYV